MCAAVLHNQPIWEPALVQSTSRCVLEARVFLDFVGSDLWVEMRMWCSDAGMHRPRNSFSKIANMETFALRYLPWQTKYLKGQQKLSLKEIANKVTSKQDRRKGAEWTMRRSVVHLFGRGPAKPKGRGDEILGYHPRQLVELPEEVSPGDKPTQETELSSFSRNIWQTFDYTGIEWYTFSIVKVCFKVNRLTRSPLEHCALPTAIQPARLCPQRLSSHLWCWHLYFTYVNTTAPLLPCSPPCYFIVSADPLYLALMYLLLALLNTLRNQ